MDYRPCWINPREGRGPCEGCDPGDSGSQGPGVVGILGVQGFGEFAFGRGGGQLAFKQGPGLELVFRRQARSAFLQHFLEVGGSDPVIESVFA